MAWTPERQPFGQNRAPLLAALANDGSATAVPLAADPATGRLLVNATGSSGGTSSTFGTTFPTTGTAVGASDGTNMQPLQVDGSGNLKVNVETSALPTGAATAANQTNGAQLAKLFDGSNVGTIKAASTAAGATDTALVVAVSPNNTVAATQSGNWTFVPTTLNNTGTITTSSSSVISGVIQNFESGFIPTSIHGTYTGVSFGVTVSDDGGSTYYNVPVYDQNAMRWLAPGAVITPGSNASNVYWVPNIPNGAGTYLKVLASAYSTGTANVRTGGSSSGVVNLPGSFMSNIMDAAGNARGANVDANGNLNVKDYATSATGSTVPADGLYQGVLAKTALPTAVSDGQLVGIMSDKFGRPVILPQAPRDLVGFQTTTITASTGSVTVVTGVANIFSDISSVTLTNSGASATTFLLSDGTNVYTLYVPAGDMRGAVYQVPLAATTVATNWTGQCGTSTSSIICTIQFIKNR